MRILKNLKIFIVLSIILLSTSCSRFILGYTPDIEQGNSLDHKTYNKIHKGMSRSDVEKKLGSPVLNNTFNTNEYDYVYTFRPGNGKTRVENFVVSFKNDKVVRINY